MISPQVGLKSMVMDELYKVNCNDAWNISIELDQAKANELGGAGYWSDQDRIRKTIRWRDTCGEQRFRLPRLSVQEWPSKEGKKLCWTSFPFPPIHSFMFRCAGFKEMLNTGKFGQVWYQGKRVDLRGKVQLGQLDSPGGQLGLRIRALLGGRHLRLHSRGQGSSRVFLILKKLCTKY